MAAPAGRPVAVSQQHGRAASQVSRGHLPPRCGVWTQTPLLPVSRWWARQIIKNIPPSDMLEVRAKVAALTALRGERKDWGVGRAWERDYLANVSDITQLFLPGGGAVSHS